MLSWDDFRYVKAIADTRSLAGAAELLGVNHSTVFRRLDQIEQQLASRLFERGRGGYAPTPSGECMIELAERMGEDIVSFERTVTGQDLRPSGELRVTTSDAVLLHLLSEILIGFRRAFPDIVLDIVVSNQRFNLSKRDADVAVRTTDHNPDPLSGSEVARIAWGVFGPAALAGQPFDPAIDAGRHDWVAFGDTSRPARQRNGSTSMPARSALSTR
jgi:DNA-binding transcriptional LysR family regulator